MNLFIKKDTPYDKSKEYLDRQQKLDYLVILTKIVEGRGMDNQSLYTVDTNNTARKQIDKILEDFK